MSSLTPPPSKPQRGVRATFAGLVDGFISWFCDTFYNDLVAFQANLNAIAAGGAYAIPYVVDLTTTADADPGAGKLRFDSATQNAAATLRLDLTVGGLDYTSVLDTFDASTSTVKGTIRLVKQGDLTKFLIFGVTARTAPTGYRNISVSPITSSSPNPFANGDAVMLFFQRTGDMGATGSVASSPMLYVREEQPSGAAPSGSPSLGTWTTRVFNTVKVNEISGASLSNNLITLPAGTYEYEGSSAIGGNGTHKAQLYNVTDAAPIDSGTTETVISSSSGSPYSVSRSLLRGKVVLTAQKVLSVRYYINGSAGTLAGPVGAGVPEVYTEIRFKKVA